MPDPKPPSRACKTPPEQFRSETPTVPNRSVTVPPKFTEIDEALVLTERVFLDRLEQRARRAQLLTALLQAKGLTPDAGARAVQAALGAVALSAEVAQIHSLASLSRALQAAIGELGIVPKQPSHPPSDVLVLDEDEVSCDLVALAVEAQGHVVRCATSFEDFVRHLDERLPDLIVTEIELSNASARSFVEVLQEQVADRPVPLVFFSGTEQRVLDELASAAKARAAISKDEGIAGLAAALDRVLQGIRRPPQP